MSLSHTSIGRAAKQLGLKPYHRRKKPAMSEADKKRRLKFAQSHKDESWDQVFFEDEKTFELGHHPNSKNDVVYAHHPDEVPDVPRVSHPAKVNVAAAVSVNGRSSLSVFEGTLTGERFRQILQRTILPAAKQTFGDDRGGWPWITIPSTVLGP